MVTLYSTGCPKCEVLIKKLNNKNIEYSVCDDTGMMSDLGITNVPVLNVDDTLMEFTEAISWVNNQ